MPITKEELNPHNYPMTEQQKMLFEWLLVAMNQVRNKYGKPMIVTSGFRSKEDQERINPTVKNSAHMMAAACDINDPDKNLWGWCLDNLDFIAKCGLYLENRLSHQRHVHFQVIAPESKMRIFNP